MWPNCSTCIWKIYCILIHADETVASYILSCSLIFLFQGDILLVVPKYLHLAELLILQESRSYFCCSACKASGNMRRYYKKTLHISSSVTRRCYFCNIMISLNATRECIANLHVSSDRGIHKFLWVSWSRSAKQANPTDKDKAGFFKS